ncbi:M56 family metallopeptidase [Salinimicrobium sp. GXAS 041]|uniref:M56 family metallopeptidase n=1 Tax=Salinimicrobium sp. GXAS 041 TaxID=3400806 RepID=UPI003C747C08
MESFLIYILKSAALSSIFLIGYLLLLKNDTSFSFNRYFLLGGIFSSFLLPGIKFTRKVYVERTAPILNFESLNSTAELISSPPVITDWWQIAEIIYFSIVALLLARLAYRFYNLYKLTSGLQKIKKNGFIYCISSAEIQPFSFFKYIVYNPHFHSPEELAMILKHERTHARQWHSIDVLFVNLLCILLWFNPLNKWYRNSLIQNLEYLADQETAAVAPSKKAYQKAILKASMGDLQPVLANQFYQSSLKKRILMLNKNSTQKPHFWKLSLVLPFIFLFLFAFNVKTEAQITTNDSISSPVVFETEISATINKNSTRAHLKEVEKIFKKQHIELSFDDLESSKEGFLIRVSASFKELSGASGNMSLNNSEGISPFEIYSNKQGTGFRTSSNSFDKKEDFHDSDFSKIGANPLYIIGDKKYTTKALSGKHLQVEGEMNILPGEEAIKLYGKAARDGVVVVKNGKIIPDFGQKLKQIDAKNKAVSRLFLQIEEGNAPALIQLQNDPEENKNSSKPKVRKARENIIPEAEDIIAIQENKNQNFHLQNARPLVVIEGEIQEEDFELDQLDPEKMKHLNVLKGENATKKYGKKAENGVLEVTLKSNEEMSKSQAAATAGSAKNGKVSYRIEKITFEDDKHTDKNIVKLITPDSSGPLDLLIVVDGEVKENDFNTDSIDHTNVESITVLKGDKAIKKYGEKAKKGVLEITLKK